jgi:hypothetical protein
MHLFFPSLRFLAEAQPRLIEDRLGQKALFRTDASTQQKTSLETLQMYFVSTFSK